MFTCLFDSLMIDCHLLWEILLKPFVIIHMVMNEAKGILKLDFHCCFAHLTVVEPSLGKPSYACLVTIDTDESRDIKTLDVNIK